MGTKPVPPHMNRIIPEVALLLFEWVSVPYSSAGTSDADPTLGNERRPRQRARKSNGRECGRRHVPSSCERAARRRAERLELEEAPPILSDESVSHVVREEQRDSNLKESLQFLPTSLYLTWIADDREDGGLVARKSTTARPSTSREALSPRYRSIRFT